METKEEAELVKKALQHYKKRLEEFKRKKTQEDGFHSSMFPDIDNDIHRTSNLIPKISVSYGYNSSEARTMAKALEVYKRDLATIRNETKKNFPEIEEREIEKLATMTIRVRAEFPNIN